MRPLSYKCKRPYATGVRGFVKASPCLYTGKRVQANMAAKNHAVVMPDADKQVDSL
jgi:acyl-CoA reductase-like NAD-dependent aldehyde dehydrogenase